MRRFLPHRRAVTDHSGSNPLARAPRGTRAGGQQVSYLLEYDQHILQNLAIAKPFADCGFISFAAIARP